MTPEYIYSKMFPGKKINKQIIWNLTSGLLNLSEDFLMQVSLSRNKFIREWQVADEFLERRLVAFFGKKLDDMEKALDKSGIDSSYFKFKSQLEEGRMSYHFLEDTQSMVSNHLLKKGEYAILHFMRDISDVIGSMKVSANMYNAEFRVNIPREFIKHVKLDEIIKYANKNQFKYSALFEMYYCSIMQVLEFNDTSYFFRLKELFEQNYNIFPKNEKSFWATELTNYCVQKVNLGDKTFREMIFEIDKFKLKEGIVYQGKYIPKVLYLQILANAIGSKQFEWSIKYIEEFAPKLKPAYQNQMRALSYGFLYYRKKEYDKVFEFLSKAKFTDALDKVYVKSLYLRIYFELDETEILLNFIDSTKHFLGKNRTLGVFFKNNYVRFLNVLSKLIVLKDKYDDFEMEKLIKTINEDKALPLAEWFMEKIDEIKK
jgi:tetratricopeptide (TPR) repeat protein